jgi:hypothetical protein
MKSLQDIESDVARLARCIGASLHDLPTYGFSRDGAHPHVELDAALYHYVVVRGQEVTRRSSANYDDLLYWIFGSVTHDVAFFYEFNHRVEDQDCRRIAFAKQIELMKQLGPEMGRRIEADMADILRRAPYDDEPARP